MPEPGHDDIHRTIAEFARDLERTTRDPDLVISALTEYAATVIPGADHAGISLAEPGDLTTPATTGDYPVILDRIQQEVGQGPCLSAMHDHRVYEVVDLQNDDRWPLYQREALVATPVRSVLSFELFSRSGSMAALNIYADRPFAFDQSARNVGHMIATHTAFAQDSARAQKQFAAALAGRDIIGQAKGMTMERYGIDAVQALELIEKLAAEEGSPVVDVARRLVPADEPPAEERRP